MSCEKAYSILKYTSVCRNQDFKITISFSLKIKLDRIFLAKRAKHELSISAVLSQGSRSWVRGCAVQKPPSCMKML